MLRQALVAGTSANAFFLPVLTKVDFFGLGRSEFDESEFARRRPVVVSDAGESLVIKAPEDSVLRKLLWFREGGSVSDKQWRDVVAILRVNRANLAPSNCRAFQRCAGAMRGPYHDIMQLLCVRLAR